MMKRNLRKYVGSDNSYPHLYREISAEVDINRKDEDNKKLGITRKPGRDDLPG